MEKKMRLIGIRITSAQYGWLGKVGRETGKNRSEVVRDVIDTNMRIHTNTAEADGEGGGSHSKRK